MPYARPHPMQLAIPDMPDVHEHDRGSLINLKWSAWSLTVLLGLLHTWKLVMSISQNLRADMYHRMQVMQFWKKAERVMVYKRQSQLDARKKVAMDKHLSFLVGSLDILKHGVAVHPLAAWLCYSLPGMMQ